MNLDNIDKLIEIVPMHYGEAVQLYPWIKETDCEDYEWCNRTSIENAVWLILELQKLLSEATVKVQSFCHPPNVLHCKLQIYPDYDCSKCEWKLDKTSET